MDSELDEFHISKIKNIDKIIIGNYEIEAWYYSPFPSEFTQNKCLYICEFCLKYMSKKETLISHLVSKYLILLIFTYNKQF